MSSISRSETEINTKNPAEEDDGVGIGSLSLTENNPSSDYNKPAEDGGGGIGPLSPSSDYNLSPSNSDVSYGSIDYGNTDGDVSYLRSTPPSDNEERPMDIGTLTGPCLICGGAHVDDVCFYRYFCPIGKQLGEGFAVLCPCLAEVVNGTCPRGCDYETGRAAPKQKNPDDSMFYRNDTIAFPEHAEMFPNRLPCKYEWEEGDNLII